MDFAEVVLNDQKRIARVRELAPQGVDHIVEVAFGANIDADVKLLKQGGSIASYATDNPTPKIPFCKWYLRNIRVFFLGSDDFPKEAKMQGFHRPRSWTPTARLQRCSRRMRSCSRYTAIDWGIECVLEQEQTLHRCSLKCWLLSLSKNRVSEEGLSLKFDAKSGRQATAPHRESRSPDRGNGRDY